MNLLHTIAGTLGATTIMTLFSYGWSYITKTQTKEPELLNRLINTYPLLPFHPSYKSSHGWLVHYLIGWGFILGFYWLWDTGIMPTTFIAVLGMGAGAGIIGIVGWATMFTVHKRPPEISKANFYFQLFIAHVIFGIGAYIVYNFFVFQ